MMGDQSDMTEEERREAREELRAVFPPMSDDDWDLLCERMAARLSGEPHVHTRLCIHDEDG